MANWEWGTPWALLLIAVLPFLFVRLRRSTGSVSYSSLHWLNDLPVTWRQRWAWLPAAIVCVGFAAWTIALARPRVANASTPTLREGIAIMMVIDRSSSMRARDLVEQDTSQDRLEVVQNVFTKFLLGDDELGLPGRASDMVGLTTFAGFADSICPLTSDHQNLDALVQQLEIEDDPNEDGTAIGDGLGLAVERLRQSDAESKVVILLTDGVHNAGVVEPRKASALAAAFGIRVYGIGAGTNGIAPVPVRDPFSGRIVLRGMDVEIDEELLRDISEQTGGTYFRATNRDSLVDVYSEIDRLERSPMEEIRYLTYTEYFLPFVLAGLIFIVVGTLLEKTGFRRLPG